MARGAGAHEGGGDGIMKRSADDAGIRGGQGRSAEDVYATGLTALFTLVGLLAISTVIIIIAAIVDKLN